jgi:hypothetical protein
LKQFTSVVDRLIFETRSKSLTKLGTEPVLAVITDFPIEFLRMIYKALLQVFDIPPEHIATDVNRMRETITGSSLSNRNPWLDMNNQNMFKFTDQKTKHEIEIELQFVGNEALWGIKISYERVLEKNRTIPIRIGALTANQLIEKFIAKVKQVMTDLKPRYPRTPESEEATERAERGLKKIDPPIVAQLQPFFKAHLLYFGEERSEKRNVHRFFFRPSFSKYGIGNWSSRIADKISWGDINDEWGFFSEPLRKFEYTFQFDELERTLPLVWKKLKENNIVIQNGGFTGDYVWFETYPGSREAEHPSYRTDDGKRFTYGEVEEMLKKHIKEGVAKEKEQAKSMTLQGFKQYLIKTALENVKRERKR